MEGARVGIFEDDTRWVSLLKDVIEEHGHTVAVAAGSIEEARAAIEELDEDALDVAVVDGNLDPDVRTGDDGAEISRLLQGKLGSVTIIGFSGNQPVFGADYNVFKVGDPEEQIPTIIAEL
jgi:DNA-binding response OmpR family regulator